MQFMYLHGHTHTHTHAMSVYAPCVHAHAPDMYDTLNIQITNVYVGIRIVSWGMILQSVTFQ